MKTLVFNDPVLRYEVAAIGVQAFLSGVMAANGDAISRIAWSVEGDGERDISLSVTCHNKYGMMLIDGIQEVLIETRLYYVQNILLERLAWKFSSPALTSAFRASILAASPGGDATSTG